MQIDCPSCRHAIEIEDTDQSGVTLCPSCGSSVSFLDPTVDFPRPEVQYVDQFRLLHQLGEGQFGTVWKAQDEQLRRTVALKLPRRSEVTDEIERMFLREAQAAAALEHPNIVRVYEVGKDDDQIFIASEFIDGSTLKEYARTESLGIEKIASIMETVARAMHSAHEAGIVHRDLKPANILMDRQGRPYITDFGIAKQTASQLTHTATESGMVMGTAAYMPPEQALGDSRKADGRSDVYSLGVILYELLSRQRPFESYYKMVTHFEEDGPAPSVRAICPEVDLSLDRICSKCLSTRSSDRYQTALELAEDLHRYQNNEPVQAIPVPPLTRALRWLRRNLPLTAAALLCVVSVGAVAFSVVAPKNEQPEAAARSYLPPTVSAPVEDLAVEVKTEPSGAQVYFYPVSESTGVPDMDSVVVPSGRTPVTHRIAPGFYLVVAVLDDGRFHEVYRTVPENATDGFYYLRHRRWLQTGPDSVELPTIEIPDHDVVNGMVEFEGAEEFVVGFAGDTALKEHPVSVRPFLISPHEVTWEEFMASNEGKPSAGIGNGPRPDDLTVPITGLFFDEAVYWAEKVGCRLPTEFEFEFAATNSGTTMFPWGNGDLKLPNDLISVNADTLDRSIADQNLTGLFSNGAEFTDSPGLPYFVPEFGPALQQTLSDRIVVRGGPYSASANEKGPVEDPEYRKRWQQFGARNRVSLPRDTLSSRIGFRCARSVDPRIPRSGATTSEPLGQVQ